MKRFGTSVSNHVSFTSIIFFSKQNSTPKKNVSANGINKGSTSQQVLADPFQVDTPVPDLRLEAKISAEVSALLLALLEFFLIQCYFCTRIFERLYAALCEIATYGKTCACCKCKQDDKYILFY